MKHLEDFLKPTQEELFKMLCKKFQGKSVCSEGNFILVEGDAPVMLLAHLDTVHVEPVKEICASDGGNILTSPQGIGGDDRCGVYALIKCYESAEKKPYLLFTCDEEIGGVGAEKFCKEYRAGTLPAELDSLKLLVEIDRRGENDAVYYNCRNSDFEEYISSKGFKTAYGSFSDISVIAPEMDIAAVNLSSGYYNAHTLSEFINVKQLEVTIDKVKEIISDAAQVDFPKYRYTVHRCYFSPELPEDLPEKYAGIYWALLEIFDEEEIENYRQIYGDEVLELMYRAEFDTDY